MSLRLASSRGHRWPALAALLVALLMPCDRALAEDPAVAAELFGVPAAGLVLGPFEGTPPSAEVRKDGRLLGYLVSSRDAIGSVGYSGKPVDMLVGLNRDGRITGATVLEHHEPILLVGIPESSLNDFVISWPLDSIISRLHSSTNK